MHIFELGMEACLAGKTLAGCPYDCAICSETHDAWKDGWLDASCAHCRMHNFAIAAHRHAKTSMLSANRSA